MKASWWLSRLLLLCVCAAGIANADTLAEYEGFNYPVASKNWIVLGAFGRKSAWLISYFVVE
jgi:hypothetical protein